MKDLSIKRLLETPFMQLYKEFILDINMDRSKYLKILSIAVVFLNSKNIHIKNLGYRIVVIYSNRTNDYKPLYEISTNLNLIPISNFIEQKSNYCINIFIEFNIIKNNEFNINNIYYTGEQINLIKFYNENHNNTLSVIAPTSYGKTELIISTIKNSLDKNICVITPTKSLLVQTKTRIMKALPEIDQIITHPEMYNGIKKNIIAVLTQERVLRLLKQSNDIKFDYVIIDEAHGLLKNDERSVLLASTILILQKKNRDCIFKFLTPFLFNSENLKIKYSDYSINSFKVDEYVKTEKIYLVDLIDVKQKVYFYDQFINQKFEIEAISEKVDDIKFIIDNSLNKNIIYLNKPRDIELVVKKFIKFNSEINIENLDEICKDIAKYVHPEYELLDCLKHGLIYHHGSMIEPIKIYMENIYCKIPEIKYVITSSTLLEGVNIPAERMFMLDIKKGQAYLSASDFKNLIGRVCRFNQIFTLKNKNLSLLEPSIYIIKSNYCNKRADIFKFVSDRMNVSKKNKDDVSNVLLEQCIINNENSQSFTKAQEFVENYEEGIIKNYKLRKVNTTIGKSCFLNNITELNIFDCEYDLEQELLFYNNNNITIVNTEQLFITLQSLFFSRIEKDEIKRFQYKQTRKFYKMFMDWRINSTSLNQMISCFVNYWEKLVEDEKDTIVFVGKWGDITRNGYKTLWTDIKTKTKKQKINLAIVRIKEEQDFLDNTIMKFVEVLNDVNLIEKICTYL